MLLKSLERLVTVFGLFFKAVIIEKKNERRKIILTIITTIIVTQLLNFIFQFPCLTGHRTIY